MRGQILLGSRAKQLDNPFVRGPGGLPVTTAPSVLPDSLGRTEFVLRLFDFGRPVGSFGLGRRRLRDLRRSRVGLGVGARGVGPSGVSGPLGVGLLGARSLGFQPFTLDALSFPADLLSFSTGGFEASGLGPLGFQPLFLTPLRLPRLRLRPFRIGSLDRPPLLLQPFELQPRRFFFSRLLLGRALQLGLR